MSEAQEKFESWVKLELMGRKVIIGRATEVTLAGAPLLRVDVPANGDTPAFTQFYGPSAIYCITPITEEMAIRAAPVSAWEMRPAQQQIEGLGGEDEWSIEAEDFDDDDEGEDGEN